MKELIIGDVVKVKGLSQLMTIEDIKKGTAEHPVCYCVWFDEKSHLHRAGFNVAVLELP